MMKTKTLNVHDALEAKLKTLRPIAAALEKLPKLKVALSARHAEQAALLNDPKFYGPGDDDRRRAVLAADAAVMTAAEAVRNVEGPGNDAQREIARIELLLNASADVDRLKKEAIAIAGEGAVVEKRVVALRGALEAITAQRDHAEAKVTAERTEAAERAIEARLEGRPAPALTARGSASADLASLDAERSAAQRQLTAATEKLSALGEQASRVRTELLRALYRVAELDFLQVLEDVRPIVERREATARVAGMGHLVSGPAFPVDEIAVRALVNELQTEHRGWEPAALTAAPTPADVDATEDAEPGAQAAA
jgi:chromosome segregation ATPase